MSKDTVKCFEYLYENVPSWMILLAQLEKKIDERPKEYIRTKAPGLPSRKRTGSAETLRGEQGDNEPSSSVAARSPSLQAQTTQSPRVDPSSRVHSYPIETQQYFQPRKRKPESAISIGGRSGPIKYRSRSLLVVYYDGDVQRTFEELVRGIGTSRNLLRKGKLAARLEALAEMAPQNSSEDEDEDDDGVNVDLDFKGMHKIQFSPRSIRMPPNVSGSPLGSRMGTAAAPAIYDRLDKALERTQITCEKAAHQYLRDGDCRLELRDAKQSLEETMKLVEPEYRRLHEKDNVESEEELDQPPELDHVKMDIATVPSVDEIEVDDLAADDTDDDDVDINLSFPRASRRMQVEIASY